MIPNPLFLFHLPIFLPDILWRPTFCLEINSLLYLILFCLKSHRCRIGATSRKNCHYRLTASHFCFYYQPMHLILQFKQMKRFLNSLQRWHHFPFLIFIKVNIRVWDWIFSLDISATYYKYLCSFSCQALALVIPFCIYHQAHRFILFPAYEHCESFWLWLPFIFAKFQGYHTHLFTPKPHLFFSPYLCKRLNFMIAVRCKLRLCKWFQEFVNNFYWIP